MNQRSILIVFLVLVMAIFGGFVYHDMKTNGKLGKLLGDKPEEKSNWQWDDNWNSNGPTPDKQIKPQPQPRPQPDLKKQIIAGSYSEALKVSGETGRPVLAFFTADWCTWCRKMKSETMPNGQVQAVLKNYVLVYVDTDKDRAPANKFGVTGLPSYVITNYKEEKLKFDSGYKNAGSFANWLNDSSLFDQPKREGQVAPPKSTPPTQPDRSRPRIRPQQPG